MCACICIYLSGSQFRVWVHGTIRCFGREIFTRLCLILNKKVSWCNRQTLHFTPRQTLHFTPRQTLHFTPRQTLHFTPRQTLHFNPRQTLHFTPRQTLHFTPRQTLHFTPRADLTHQLWQTLHHNPGRPDTSPLQTLHITRRQTLHNSPGRPTLHPLADLTLHPLAGLTLHSPADLTLHPLQTLHFTLGRPYTSPLADLILHPWQTLYFTPGRPYTSPPGRPSCLFQHKLEFSEKHSAMLQLLHKDYYLKTYPPLSIARYSFAQPSELRQFGLNEITQTSKRQQENKKLGSLD